MFDKKKYSSERKVTNVEKNYEEFLMAMAEKYKDHWVGCSPGDPGDGHPAPDHLGTKILTIYQQHNDRHCLAFSLASALFHNGFVLQCLPRQRNSFTCFLLTEQYPVKLCDPVTPKRNRHERVVQNAIDMKLRQHIENYARPHCRHCLGCCYKLDMATL